MVHNWRRRTTIPLCLLVLVAVHLALGVNLMLVSRQAHASEIDRDVINEQALQMLTAGGDTINKYV